MIRTCSATSAFWWVLVNVERRCRDHVPYRKIAVLAASAGSGDVDDKLHRGWDRIVLSRLERPEPASNAADARLELGQVAVSAAFVDFCKDGRDGQKPSSNVG